jgi:hypothetical protein
MKIRFVSLAFLAVIASACGAHTTALSTRTPGPMVAPLASVPGRGCRQTGRLPLHGSRLSIVLRSSARIGDRRLARVELPVEHKENW